MSNLAFVDTHVHFWDNTVPELGGYDWLAPGGDPSPVLGDFEAVKAPKYLPENLAAEGRFSNLAGVVHVQAALGIADPVEETRWLQRLSDGGGGVPGAAIAAVDLTAPDAADTLARHAAFPIFRGVRDLRYDDYLENEAWLAGFARLDEGLVLCDDPQVEQMATAARVAATNPAITYCVDHAGFPRRRDAEYFGAWRTGMRTLAAVPNTVVKISGLGMCDHRWTVDSIRPWALECIDAWGVDRAFFGTNWPLDRLFSSYADVVAAYAELIADFTPEEQRKLFAENANRIFDLEDAAS